MTASVAEKSRTASSLQEKRMGGSFKNRLKSCPSRFIPFKQDLPKLVLLHLFLLLKVTNSASLRFVTDVKMSIQRL